jgi:hypothetical protein
MTAHCRPLLLAAAAGSLLLPACLFIGGTTTTPITPPETRDKLAERSKEATHKPALFAELLPRPGGTVAIKPADKKDGKTATPKDNKDAGATAKRPPDVAPDPKPVEPPGGVTVAGEPGTFPITVAKRPADPPLLEAVRAYIENRPGDAIEILKQLGLPNQEIVLAVLPALARAATADLANDPATAALLAEQFRAAARSVEQRAALVAENVALCRKVEGFGRYDPWPAGQPYRPNGRAELYVEVRNLVSHQLAAPTPGGDTHLTHVRVAVEVRDAHGTLVEQVDIGGRRVPVVRFEKKVFSRGPVEDFYVYYAFQVPPVPGVYTVTVELRDPAGRRTAKTAPVRFDVAGP